MRLLLQRYEYQAGRTFGRLFVHDSRFADDEGAGVGWRFFCFTLEDPDRGLDAATEETWAHKVKGSTAIPTGSYDLELYDSPKHGPATPQLVGVPAFRNVQIHPGNTEADTLGCILPGLTRDATRVLNSRKACEWLYPRIRHAINKGERATITVTRAPADRSIGAPLT